MGTNHLTSPTLSERPFRHVSSFSIEDNQALGDIAESFEILEEKPGHLGPMHIPNRYVSVNRAHILGHFANRFVVFEGVVLSVDIVEQGGCQESSVYGCINLGLVIL